MFTYTPTQADALIAAGALRFYPWHHYSRRPDSTLAEFEIDHEGTLCAAPSQYRLTQADCAAQWLIVTLCKCELQARTMSPHAWRDHRLRLIRDAGLPY